MHRAYKFLAGMVFLFITLLGVRAFAQGGATGAISGVVEDSSGATIADAEVQIPTTGIRRLEIAGALEFQRCPIRRREVGRTT